MKLIIIIAALILAPMVRAETNVALRLQPGAATKALTRLSQSASVRPEMIIDESITVVIPFNHENRHINTG